MIDQNQNELILEIRDKIAFITLNRPNQHNALSKSLLESLNDNLDEIKKDNRVKVAIIFANGKSFCSGHDLLEIKNTDNKEAFKQLFELCSKVMTKILRLQKPVIAGIQGTATAAGCQLVASCDLAVASENATFATPGVNIGLFCSTPMVALSRNVGRKHAMEMLLLGDSINTEKALEIGLINRIVQAEILEEETINLALKIASKSSKILSIGKDAFYKQLEMDIEQAYKYTSEIMTKNMLELDAKEGIDAFIKKRTPQWKEDN